MSFDEFKQSYAVHKMGEQETVAVFDCGDEDLNGFILTDAPFYRKEKMRMQQPFHFISKMGLFP